MTLRMKMTWVESWWQSYNSSTNSCHAFVYGIDCNNTKGSLMTETLTMRLAWLRRQVGRLQWGAADRKAWPSEYLRIMSIVNIITNMAIWLVTCPLSNASRKERAGKLLQELLVVPVGVQGEESRPCSILCINIYMWGKLVISWNHCWKNVMEQVCLCILHTNGTLPNVNYTSPKPKPVKGTLLCGQGRIERHRQPPPQPAIWTHHQGIWSASSILELELQS